MTTETAQPRGMLRVIADRPAAFAGSYLLLAIVLAAFGWSGLWSMFSLLPGGVSPWWGLATAAPACALVLLRRRAPLVGLIAAAVVFVADLLTVGGLVPLLVLLELFHARTVRLAPAQRRRMLGVVIVSTLALVVAALALSDDPREAVMVGIQFVGLAGLTYWYANSVAQSRELVALYRQRADDTARLAELDRTAAVQGERDRMARELHDVVAGHISAIAIRSEAALGLPAGAAGETQERRALRAMRDASLEAHGALRTMI
ncbi:histidine kinase [Leucobacter chironomi]|uniref:histidine kinase n=1 Tax=Leucobacter chironomi TaxID=491918 RepID=UPI000A030965|nr:histidine kinase dimerization/phosphoacceptor domain-containing protein [Leucobacter chironomi]